LELRPRVDPQKEIEISAILDRQYYIPLRSAKITLDTDCRLISAFQRQGFTDNATMSDREPAQAIIRGAAITRGYSC